MARFEDLAVWKRSARLSAELYKALRDLKDFGFRDQITRAGLSIPSNIAEGFERESAKETTCFLNYAKGSAGELRTQLYIAMDIGYIERETAMAWIRETEEISRMLHGLMKTIRDQKK
ncbi:four helix bundle protein [Desulfoglaeba alkanexedens]|uniref:Four helix bundle protein n=1 Tax=Desulfoglaeba alkanexedens ALDC TaxID=980445 RepID=A0A4P8KZ44_9BACT|nr:four helix bundle protein [Desulfoglaeba alkanexedens]QCQ20806.1 four helix bundle protein [Desulfoglaeba alkanexedens ALDC]